MTWLTLMIEMGPHRADDRIPGAPVVSPPPSPYPGRRAPLPTKTENELRTACAGVLVNTKPSHHYVPEDHSNPPVNKPQLDYEAVKRSASMRRSQDSRPAMPRADSADTTHPVKYTYRPDATIDQLFTPVDSTNDLIHSNHIKRKDDTLSPNRSKTPVPIKVVSPSGDVIERPRPAQRSLSAGTTDSTPHTDVTEYPWSTSTAPTSAGITPARTSKRASSHMQADQEQASKVDAAAIEWMRMELDRRRNKEANVKEAPAPQPPSRPPSRARSIRNNIKEYIRPSTANASRESSRPVSRSASRGSLRAESQDRSRDISFRGGWRSWGRTRKDEATSDISRSGSLRGRSETRQTSTANKSDINLNRELPPLPSLDQWKDEPSPPNPIPVQKHQSAKSRHGKASKSLDSNMSEKDEIIAARLGSPVKERPDAYQPTRSPMTSTSTKMPVFGSAHTHDNVASSASVHSSSTPRRSKSTTRLHSRNASSTLRVVPSASDIPAVPLRRKNSINYSRIRSPGSPLSGDTDFASSPSTGFSQHRNYNSSKRPPALNGPKTEKTTQKHAYEQKYRHVMEVLKARSPPPVPPKDDKKAWWNLRAKSRKPSNWMDELERKGIRDGVIDEACGAPVIRY